MSKKMMSIESRTIVATVVKGVIPWTRDLQKDCGVGFKGAASEDRARGALFCAAYGYRG